LSNVRRCLQGVDLATFHPAPRAGWMQNRFVIFSGGKLEFRKGQDIVIAAFREFYRRHPEALLMVAWHNFWPETMIEIGARGYVKGIPGRLDNGQLDLQPWLEHNGLPRHAVLDLGKVPHGATASILREADVAVFPNRAEGGTNLVAMECMACGVPTVLSKNTGHLDLIEKDNCYVLHDQADVEPTHHYRGTGGWGETSVAELVETLEHVFESRGEAERRGIRGSQTLEGFGWRRQIDEFLLLSSDVLGAG
jgi:glycosyltransferase involved in cell wall biosynthesis